MKRTTQILRLLLAGPDAIVYCGAYDALSARIAQQLGFPMVGVGGNSMGSRLTTSEPVLSLEDVVRQSRYITAAVDIPVKIDAGAGFGEPLHVMRTVRELEAAGVAALHLEDQIFPKRAHYHRNLTHVIPAEDMVVKVKAAVAAKRDPDLVIVARTDAMLSEGWEGCIKRANMYLEAGADAIYTFPKSLEQVKQAPKEINGPCVYGVSDGNRKGRPILSVRELEDLGYKVISFPTTATMTTAVAMKNLYQKLLKDGPAGFNDAHLAETKRVIAETQV